MSGLVYSHHARTRMQQRGLRKRDIELIVDFGTRIADDAYLLRRRDVDRQIERRRREIQALERLRDHKVVVVDDTIVTCYRPHPSVRKQDIRGGREKAWLRRQRRYVGRSAT